MATPRKRYRVDVCIVDDMPHALIRRNPGNLTWVWCTHHVKATGNDRAEQKAIRNHLDSQACQQFEQEKTIYLADLAAQAKEDA